jgi:hypothetical protein
MKQLLALTAACLVLTNCECGFMPVAEGDAGQGGGAGGGTGGGGETGGGAGGGAGGGEVTGGGAGGGDVDAGQLDAGELDAGEIDAGEVDAGAPDAGLSCVGRDGAACTLSAMTAGLCRGDLCVACAGPADDGACTQAYGTGADRWLCEGGQCVDGECRSDSDCASVGKAGQICGVAASNQCGRCTADPQCQASSYGTTSICNVAVGLCVPGACSTPNSACSANPADFCCGSSCVPGNCCTSAQCSSPGAICLNNACTTCTAVANGIYYVDPVTGSNTAGNGSPTCPFRSLSRGVQYINGVFGSAIPAGTRLVLRGTSSSSTGETFPIAVPTNVMVQSEDAGMPQRVIVGAMSTGFTLTQPNSGVRSLVIDGADAGFTGIRVGTGATTTTTITDVTAQNLRQTGIRVEAGTVSIGAGVVATGNGAGTSACPGGLCISGGLVNLSVPAGQTPSRFDQNVSNGIAVNGTGRLMLTGVPDLTGFPANQNPPAIANGTGTITASQNQLANFAFSSNNGMASVIDGLVTTRGAGNGFNLAASSTVTLRNCVSVQNAQSGVQISPSGAGNFSGINLGNATAPGQNVFQSTAHPNTRSGICVGNFLNFNLTLQARGNHFAASKSCVVATTPVTSLTTSRAGCMGASDVGIETSFNNPQTNVGVSLEACQNL